MTYTTPVISAAKEFAQNFGVKGVIFGPSGVGKTPIPLATAPRPLLVLHEAGAGSLKHITAPATQAFTIPEVENFYEWFELSKEADAFDTLIVDSSSELASIYLEDIMNGTSKGGNKVHGMAAYGDMAKAVNKILRKLYFRKWKHILLIAKQEIINTGGVNMRRPVWPGQQLNVDVPHLMDNIFHQAYYDIPGYGNTIAVRCKGTFDTMARDRFGNLAELEAPDYGAIITKCMQ